MIRLQLIVVLIISIVISATSIVDKMINVTYIDPHQFDVLLQDLPINKLRIKTTEIFNYEYNSPTSQIASYPIFGVIIHESFNRVFIPIIISYKKKKIATVCIVDTGSP